MSENKMSTSGMLEDLIRSMVQLASQELHAKTALEKAQHQLEVSDSIDLDEALNKLTVKEEHLKKVTDLRRSAMKLISEYGRPLDEEMWCEVKHSAMAMYTAFEAYQANDNTKLYDYYIEMNNLFIETITAFLGIDIPPCASCFSDALKVVK